MFIQYVMFSRVNKAYSTVMLWILGCTALLVVPGYSQVQVALYATPHGGVSIGTTVRIRCSFANNNVAPSTLYWTHDGKEIDLSPLHGGKYTVSHKTTHPPETVITIKDCDEGDGGLWTCTGRFPHSYISSRPIRGPVYLAEGSYELEVGVPKIQYIPRDLAVSVGEKLRLKCNATGDPEPNVMWTKTSFPSASRSSSVVDMTVSDEEFKMKVMHVSDGGKFTCIAENKLGVDTSSINIYVDHAPTFPTSRETVVVKGKIGVLVTLSVTVSAYPFPLATWFKEGVALTNQNLFLVNTKDGIYSLQVVPEESDFGSYSCIIENEYGRIEQNMLLMPSGPPMTPLNVTPKRVTLTSILLSAGASAVAGGVPVTKYRVFYREVGRVPIRRKLFTSTDEILLTGLREAGIYAIYVSAGNQAGWSSYSDAIFVSTRVETATTPISPTTVPKAVTTSIGRHGPSSNTAHSNNTGHVTTELVHPIKTTIIPGRPGLGNDTTAIPAQTAVVMVTKYPLNNTTAWQNDSRKRELSPTFEDSLSVSTGARTNQTKLTPPGGPSAQRSAIFIICLVLVSIVCMMVVGCCLFMASTFPIHRWIKGKRKHNDDMEETLYERPNSLHSEDTVQYRIRPLPSLISSFFSTPPPPKVEFPQENLHLGNLIGQGSFGVVYEAEAHGIVRRNETTKVAIKLLKEDHNDLHEVAFQKELAVMTRLKPHPFIVTLLGCCTMSEPQIIIMEYLPLENLLTHLRKSRLHVTNHMTQRVSLRTSLSPSDLIRYGYEVANGMSYLASMKCMHRDLAARNILRSKDDVCKLADFSLARDVIKDGIAHRKTQGRSSIRWMSTESLLENVFTIRSNVWSFGVLLWEIVTIGAYPYSGITSGKLTRFLQDGKRMPKPDHCSQELYSLMMQCWQTDPKKRPTFPELSRKLEAKLSENSDYLVLEGSEDGIYECLEYLGRR